jgi:NitT/TauT family transport system substrate-binding protein
MNWDGWKGEGRDIVELQWQWIAGAGRAKRCSSDGDPRRPTPGGTVSMKRWLALVLSVATFAFGGGAKAAQQIVVSNYGIAANGMPYAVALAKGFFKQAGADVSGILSSQGGGTTIRNLQGGGLDFGEVDLAGTVAAIQQGADLHIISDDVLTVGEFVWAVPPQSPIRSIKDFRGKRIGYTSPRSTSQALNVLLLKQAGMSPKDARLQKAGGFGEQIVELNLGALDVVTLADPVWSKNAARLRPIVRAADVLPPLANVVGVATGKAIAQHGDFLRAVLKARRMAVEYIYAHPDESAAIVAKAYALDPAVAKQAIHNLVAPGKPGSLPYWGLGRFDIAGMNRMLEAQKAVGALKGNVDWNRIIDRRFLPPDQQKDY